jgi:hypothetical protein
MDMINFRRGKVKEMWCVISGMKVHELLLKICQGYLATLIDVHMNYKYGIIPEWLKVSLIFFLMKVTTLPSLWEVEIMVNLLLGMEPLPKIA